MLFTKIHQFVRSNAEDLLLGKWSLLFFLILFCIAAFLTNNLFRWKYFLLFTCAVCLLWFCFQRLGGFFKRHWYTVALAAWAFPFFCFLFGSAGFLLGIPLTKWHGLFAFLSTIGIIGYLKKDWKDFWVNLALVCGLLACCLFVASFHEDFVDGILYHKPAALCMVNGWNPVWDGYLGDYCAKTGVATDALRLSHAAFFSKGQVIVVAIFYLMTGNIDSGDFVNTFLLFPTFFILFFAVKEWLETANWQAVLIALIGAFNPILLMQVHGGYIDGLLGLGLTVFLFTCMAWFKTGKKCWIPFIFLSGVQVCSVKFTGCVYLTVMAAGLTIPVLWNRYSKVASFTIPTRKNWFGLAGTTILCVLLTNVHPFITNTLQFSSPFYPLHSLLPEKYPVEDIEAPYYVSPDFRNATILQRFLYSYLLGPSVDTSTVKEDHFDIKISEIGIFQSCTWRMNFSSFFSLCFSVSLVMLFFVRKWDYWLVIVILALSIAVQPHNWWNRFVPQLWLLPVLLAIFPVLTTDCSKVLKRRFCAVFIFVSFVMLTIVSDSCFSCVRAFDEDLYNTSRWYDFIINHPDGKLVVCIPSPTGFDDKSNLDLRNFIFYFQHKMNELGLKNQIPVMSGPESQETVYHGTLYSQLRLYCLPETERNEKRQYTEITLEVLPCSNAEKIKAFNSLLKLRAHQFYCSWFPEKNLSSQIRSL